MFFVVIFAVTVNNNNKTACFSQIQHVCTRDFRAAHPVAHTTLFKSIIYNINR